MSLLSNINQNTRNSPDKSKHANPEYQKTSVVDSKPSSIQQYKKNIKSIEHSLQKSSYSKISKQEEREEHDDDHGDNCKFDINYSEDSNSSKISGKTKSNETFKSKLQLSDPEDDEIKLPYKQKNKKRNRVTLTEGRSFL